MPPGYYTFEVSASSQTNKRIPTQRLTVGTVTAVSFEGNTAYLAVGARKVALNDIVDVRLPEGSATPNDPAAASFQNSTINGGR